MSNLTADQDRALDMFHQDMLDMLNLDTQDMMQAEAEDWSPVPAEFRDMSIAEVEAEIQDMWEATR